MNYREQNYRSIATHPSHVLVLSVASLLYSAGLSEYVLISTGCQIFLILYVAGLALIRGEIIQILIISLITIILGFFQGEQSVFIAIAFYSVVLSSEMDRQKVAHVTIAYCFIYSTMSALNFYGNYTFLFEPTLYESYFFSGSRLLGLDGSPAYLSVLAGMGAILSCFFIKKRSLAIALVIFFIAIVLMTASRTAAVAITLGAVAGLVRGGTFACAATTIVAIPLIITIIYSAPQGLTTADLVLLELFTSHRVVNWSNLMIYFGSIDIQSILFGVGKPESITDPATLQSRSSAFLYSYVTYAESSILKILFYHGALVYTFALVFIIHRSYSLNEYSQRLFYIYMLFCAIYFDAIFSIQYIHLSFALFCITARMPKEAH